MRRSFASGSCQSWTVTQSRTLVVFKPSASTVRFDSYLPGAASFGTRTVSQIEATAPAERLGLTIICPRCFSRGAATFVAGTSWGRLSTRPSKR